MYSNMKNWFNRRLMMLQVWLEDKNLPNKWLFNYLYPDYNKPLTKEQAEELYQTLKKGGWYDDEENYENLIK